jgi:hypothetical protein
MLEGWLQMIRSWVVDSYILVGEFVFVDRVALGVGLRPFVIESECV